ncbi:hypothetical protein ACFE04_004179 [Oxalis oulophora]
MEGKALKKTNIHNLKQNQYQEIDYNNNNNIDHSLEENVFVFLGEGEEEDHHHRNLNDDDEDYPIKRSLYWQSQHSLLQEIVGRSNMTSSKLKDEINRTIEQAKKSDYCSCFLKPTGSETSSCTHCLRSTVVTFLCKKGFNATLSTSKWNHTKKFPGGTHQYIEVLVKTPGRKKQVLFLLELEFQDHFRIAKACDEYCRLVDQLPQYFVGKPDYLNAVVRLMCNSAKTSMKEQNLHMGPWRKKGFMEMKWSNSFGRSFDESCFQFAAAQALVVT